MTDKEKAARWIEAQGPGFILCTDSDGYLSRVAADIVTECGVDHETALAAAREFRGPQINA